MEKAAVTKQEIIAQLTRSEHGKLEAYADTVRLAATHEPEFLAHLIAWNEGNGAIRDSKIALPLYSLATPTFTGSLAENSEACLALLDPRNFVKALDHSYGVGMAGKKRSLRRLVEKYLRHREQSFGYWERAVIQHRASIKTLYGRYHVKPGSPMMQDSLFGGKPPKGSTLHVISQLGKMPPQEALGYVPNRKIPFLVAVGAMGKNLHDSDTVLALIQSMSPAELVTNAKMLERLGVKSNPSLRAAFKEGLEKAATAGPKTGETLLKASKAAEAIGGDTAKQLRSLQEKQIKAVGGVKGRWLILGDISQSMERAIGTTRLIAGFLAKVADEAHLVFFNQEPRYLNVTKHTLEQINEVTRHVKAGGGTSIGVGLQYVMQRGIAVDGVVIVSDGGEGRMPYFAAVLRDYERLHGHLPMVYHYFVEGSDPNILKDRMQQSSLDYEEFDLRRKPIDEYSIANLAKTMNTKRWSLLDQIMETPLKTLDEVFSAREA